jgi:hypothetical protein
MATKNSYKRKAIRRMLVRNDVATLAAQLEKVFTDVDANTLAQLQLSTENIDNNDNLLDNIIHCAVTDDFDQVFDDNGELVVVE